MLICTKRMVKELVKQVFFCDVVETLHFSRTVKFWTRAFLHVKYNSNFRSLLRKCALLRKE